MINFALERYYLAQVHANACLKVHLRKCINARSVQTVKNITTGQRGPIVAIFVDVLKEDVTSLPWGDDSMDFDAPATFSNINIGVVT